MVNLLTQPSQPTSPAKRAISTANSKGAAQWKATGNHLSTDGQTHFSIFGNKSMYNVIQQTGKQSVPASVLTIAATKAFSLPAFELFRACVSRGCGTVCALNPAQPSRYECLRNRPHNLYVEPCVRT